MQLCYILMYENFLLNQILVSFNFLIFVVCGFRESMHVFVVSVILSSLCDPIIAMIIMILLFGFCDPIVAIIILIFSFWLDEMFRVFLLNTTHLILFLLFLILILFYFTIIIILIIIIIIY